ncbi:MAG: hypothetical protein LBM66_04600, partial [Bifidobacteriaceae bacterium]|nr:hypothetical protein [Bifidobacteriaceae bacterium]
MNFFPGDSTGIRGNASQINTAKAPMFGWHSALFWSNLFTGWTGSDADAAKSAIDTDHQALIDAEHNYGHCADALNTFAGQLDACNAQYVKDYNAYQAALAAISPDDPNAAAEQQAAA